MTLNVTPREIVEKAEGAGTPGLLAKHESWGRVELGLVATVLNGAPFPSSMFNNSGNGMPLIRIRDVSRGDTETYYNGDYLDEFIVRKGDLLVGMDGDFTASLWRGPDALLNQRVCKISVIDERVYDKKFLALVLQGYLDALWQETSSLTVKHLSSRSVARIPLPLPPLAEQQRIVAALEEQMYRLEGALNSTECAQAKARVIWNSVLSRVADGSLLHGPGNHYEYRPISESSLVQGGVQKQGRRRPVKNKFSFLRVANVLRGSLDLENVHEIELFEGEIDKFRLESGDLLVVEGNGSPSHIGRGAMWFGEIENCVHQNHLIRVRPLDVLRPKFLELVWNSPVVGSQLRNLAISTSGLLTLSTAKIKRVSIPVPPLEEQDALIEAAGEWRTRIDAAHSVIGTASRRGKALRSSLLSAAFSGWLVPQDPEDEPASALLGRIEAERAAASSPRRRRRSSSRRVLAAAPLPPSPKPSQTRSPSRRASRPPWRSKTR